MQREPQKNSNISSLHEDIYWNWSSENLESLRATLAEISNTTEGRFLQLGNKISLFYEQARGISRLSSEVMRLLYGDDGENTLQHLQLLVERCSLWLSATDEKSADICTLLSNVMQQMSGLCEPVVGLRKVVKTLHALRVSTRIEAAKGYAAGADVQAQSLDELSRLIHEKITKISDRTEALVPMINDSFIMEEAIQSGAIRNANREIKKARCLLNDFLANCIEAGQSTDRLKDRSDDVTKNFGEIISALQFQDITRQRLDHIQDVLTGLGHHLEKFRQRSDYNHDEEALRLFGSICRLQHEQLCLASQEFLAAADNLSENLHGMIVSAVSMAEETRELSQSTVLGCDSRFAAVLEVLKMIADCLDETRCIHETAAAHLITVCQKIQEVADLVEEVERIGEEMQLLAMNAAISAAHARQQGAGLDIIAQNIHIVAGEATGHALALARACEMITVHATDLQDVGRETHSNAGNVSSLLVEADKRITTIEANGIKLMGFAAEIDQTADRLSCDIKNMVKTVDIRKDFQEKVTPVLDRLNHLGSSIDEGMSIFDSGNLDTLFIDLEHCYTMDSERRIHRQFVAKGGISPSIAVAEVDEWSTNRSHGLGDNVDLF